MKHILKQEISQTDSLKYNFLILSSLFCVEYGLPSQIMTGMRY